MAGIQELPDDEKETTGAEGVYNREKHGITYQVEGPFTRESAVGSYVYFKLRVNAPKDALVVPKHINEWNHLILESHTSLSDEEQGYPLFIFVDQSGIESHVNLAMQMKSTLDFMNMPEFLSVKSILQNTGGTYLAYPIESGLVRNSINIITRLLKIQAVLINAPIGLSPEEEDTFLNNTIQDFMRKET